MWLEGHFQNAYVTRDLEAAIELFRAKYGVASFNTYEGELEVVTPAGRGPAHNRVAFGWIGNLQIELIQPVSGLVDFYKEALPAGAGARFHHICMRTNDLDAVRRAVDAEKRPIIYEGASTGVRYFYVDARDTLGHYLEYVQMPDEIWTMMGGR